MSDLQWEPTSLAEFRIGIARYFFFHFFPRIPLDFLPFFEVYQEQYIAFCVYSTPFLLSLRIEIDTTLMSLPFASNTKAFSPLFLMVRVANGAIIYEGG